MAGRVEGKVAFITGAARGQGRSHAVRLAAEGAAIIGVDCPQPVDTIAYPLGARADLDETVRLVEAAGGRMVAHEADVRDRDALAAALADGLSEFGRLDIVAANAGISPALRPLWEITADEWREMIDVNLTGAFHTISITVPVLRAAGNGGAVVLTSSGAGLKGIRHLGAYSAAKHGVIGLALTLANELAREAIRVNALAPSTVGTPMVTENIKGLKMFRPDLENPTLDDSLAAYRKMTPMGNPWIDASDVTEALLYLVADSGRYVTGTVLSVDQGAGNRA